MRNHFTDIVNGVQTPVIPKCTAAQLYVVVGQDACSNGPITVWDPNNRAVYDGLLVKVQKRFSRTIISSLPRDALQANDTFRLW